MATNLGSLRETYADVTCYEAGAVVLMFMLIYCMWGLSKPNRQDEVTVYV